MKVVKKINHNVVLIDDEGTEKVAMGKGIGFSTSVNELFDPTVADKFFTLDSKEKTKMFTEMAAQIPIEFIEFSEEVIQFISKNISSQLDSNIYIALTDHIYFAIQRQKEDSQVTAIMLPEMKLLYPDEYETAKEVVALINQRYGTQLGANEVGFITMHIINAELGEQNSFNSLKILEMTKEIILALEEIYGYHFDTDSLIYSRMMIHIKFLAKRLVYQEDSPSENIGFFSSAFKESEPYRVASAIKKMIEEKFQLNVQENEVTYLAIHLARIQ
ncbi:PRD domain-containing protein [Candidatus Enterococcus courvalinii]|uniref:PRD domain-containing protein n=1 Tax=Candidatus Enterococcus courvalinii TaxID=2815329 RepID=A0ABS3I2F4_9ENTE|nr:PRD domain-containing protein [Enterococcus sp. MSG2901]MBO0481951.1 PRD domain-containing protein [Enterococcus sp. MSG2901]